MAGHVRTGGLFDYNGGAKETRAGRVVDDSPVIRLRRMRDLSLPGRGCNIKLYKSGAI